MTRKMQIASKFSPMASMVSLKLRMWSTRAEREYRKEESRGMGIDG